MEKSKLNTKQPFDAFMLEEYKTIASAHFDLHNRLQVTFRFFLAIAALPFTVQAVAFKEVQNLFELPIILLVVFAVTPFLGFMMFLSMIHMKLDIILYTRAVNGVRAYFVQRAKEIGITDATAFLKLPIDQHKPPYMEFWRRSSFWQFMLIAFLNAGYLLIFMKNLLSWCASLVLTILFMIIHILAYVVSSQSREREEIPGTLK